MSANLDNQPDIVSFAADVAFVVYCYWEAKKKSLKQHKDGLRQRRWTRLLTVGQLKKRTCCLQLMCAVRGFVHAVSFLQQLEELLDGDARVRRAAQREDLPHQNAKRPPEHRPKGENIHDPATSNVSIAFTLLHIFVALKNKDVGLTRRSGACRLGQTRPPAPST